MGCFRLYLYYLLIVMLICIPPLGERPEDVPVLCQFYLEHFNRKFNKSIRGIDPDFLAVLERYHWHGNVRELRNVMERCTLFSKGDLLTGAETGLTLSPRRPASGLSFPMYNLELGAIDLRHEVDAFERSYIDRAMELSGGNLSRAAELLGCTRFTLKRRLDAENSGDV